MSSTYDEIISLLSSLSDSQKWRFLECLKREESVLVCLGLCDFRIVEEVKIVDDIIYGKATDLCGKVREDSGFARIIESLIFRIKSPDDLIGEFVDYRMENWPEE